MSAQEPVVDHRMDDLTGYLDLIVEPTFLDFQRNPDPRHVFLACVAVFHAIDRLPNHKNLRKQWRDECIEFLVVDMFAHHLKHVKSSDEKRVSTKS